MFMMLSLWPREPSRGSPHTICRREEAGWTGSESTQSCILCTAAEQESEGATRRMETFTLIIWLASEVTRIGGLS